MVESNLYMNMNLDEINEYHKRCSVFKSLIVKRYGSSCRWKKHRSGRIDIIVNYINDIPIVSNITWKMLQKILDVQVRNDNIICSTCYLDNLQNTGCLLCKMPLCMNCLMNGSNNDVSINKCKYCSYINGMIMSGENIQNACESFLSCMSSFNKK